MYKGISRRLQSGREGKARRDQIGKRRLMAAPTDDSPPDGLQPRDVIRLYYYERIRSGDGVSPQDHTVPDWLAAEINRRGLENWRGDLERLKKRVDRQGTEPVVRRRKPIPRDSTGLRPRNRRQEERDRQNRIRLQYYERLRGLTAFRELGRRARLSAPTWLKDEIRRTGLEQWLEKARRLLARRDGAAGQESMRKVPPPNDQSSAASPSAKKPSPEKPTLERRRALRMVEAGILNAVPPWIRSEIEASGGRAAWLRRFAVATRLRQISRRRH